MNVDGKLLGEKIMKKYPRRGDTQLVRLGAVAEFKCSRCSQTKRARLVAVHKDAVLCNGCYGRTRADAEETEKTSGKTGRPLATAVSSPLAVHAEARALESGGLADVAVEEPTGDCHSSS